MTPDLTLPSVTFVVPTLNSEVHLGTCLSSILRQDYETERVEILVVDGGSTDATVSIAKRFQCHLLDNPTRYEEGAEGGKARGFEHASGEIVVFLDSDNELGSRTWLKNVVYPYQIHEEVSGCFPQWIGVSDQRTLSRYLAFQDPQPLHRHRGPGEMVEIPVKCDRYRLVKLTAPADLSNGASVRRAVLRKAGGYDHGFETTMRLVRAGFSTFALPVDAPVLHHLSGLGLRGYVQKRATRLSRFKQWYKAGNRDDTVSLYTPSDGEDLVVSCAKLLKALTFSTSYEALARLLSDRDRAWLYHPLVSFIDAVLHVLILWDVGLKTLFASRK